MWRKQRKYSSSEQIFSFFLQSRIYQHMLPEPQYKDQTKMTTYWEVIDNLSKKFTDNFKFCH